MRIARDLNEAIDRGQIIDDRTSLRSLAGCPSLSPSSEFQFLCKTLAYADACLGDATDFDELTDDCNEQLWGAYHIVSDRDMPTGLSEVAREALGAEIVNAMIGFAADDETAADIQALVE